MIVIFNSIATSQLIINVIIIIAYTINAICLSVAILKLHVTWILNVWAQMNTQLIVWRIIKYSSNYIILNTYLFKYMANINSYCYIYSQSIIVITLMLDPTVCSDQVVNTLIIVVLNFEPCSYPCLVHIILQP